MPPNSLEQEAMERVSRMYANYDRRPQSRQNQPQPQPPEPDPPQPPEPSAPKKQNGLMELLMQDKDQSLILLLLVVLMKDGADLNLMVALVYLLL